jgi:hypothetical protein
MGGLSGMTNSPRIVAEAVHNYRPGNQPTSGELPPQ